MKNRKSLFCLLLVLMLFIGIGTASAQGPGGLETNEDNAYVTDAVMRPMVINQVNIASNSCNDSILVISFGRGFPAETNTMANALTGLGYNVTHLANPIPGDITTNMSSNNYSQVWLWDIKTTLSLNDTDAQTIADWYNASAKGNIVVDARSYGAWYRLTADRPLIENIAESFCARCEGGLWIGTDHDTGWAYNGNKLLSTIGYGTVTGTQTNPVVAGNTSAELLSMPNNVVPSTLHAHASPGIAPNGTQPDGVVLERLLWNARDNKTLTSYSLTTNFCNDTPPVIALLGINPAYVKLNDIYNDAGATAYDYIDGDLTSSIVTVNPVDNTTVGAYIVTYNVNDSSNNSAIQVNRTVHVFIDTTSPIITMLGYSPFTIEVNSIYNDAGATAFDNYDGDLTSSIITINSVINTTLGTYTVTYNVNDSSGNAATEVTRTVNVVAAPVLDVSFDIKPGSCPNPLNLKSKGVLPVAILGTEDFDITQIDPQSITISRNGYNGSVSPIRWASEDVGTPFDDELCDCHELGVDGYMDMTLKFNTQDLIETLGLEGMSRDICLTISGNLAEEYDGTAFEGNDCVRIK